MESRSLGEIFELIVAEHLISVVLCFLTVATVAAVFILRWWLRRRWNALLQESADPTLHWKSTGDLTEADQKALEYLKEKRRRVWKIPESELSLSFESLFHQAHVMVREIAAIYYPDKNDPEYQASLHDLLKLARRVTTRLETVSSYGPFRLLASRPIADYRSLYRTYQAVQDSEIFQRLKKHKRLYRIARIAVNLKNIKNPFYWLGKELSQEGYFLLLRWFHIALVNQVGKEAIRLYSPHLVLHEDERDLSRVCLKLYEVCRETGGDRESLERWVRFVCEVPTLDADTKVKLLRTAVTESSLDNNLETVPLTPQGKRWYRKGLKLITGPDEEKK